MTTILSIHGYGISKLFYRDEIENLKKDLIMKPNINFSLGDVEEKTFNIYHETDKIIYIPRYYGLQKFGNPQIDKLGIHQQKRENLKFQGKLRDQQLVPVKNFLEAANNPLKRGGIISVPCGFGKTIMSVYIACELKVKTLFVSHKDFLNQQFRDTVSQFVPSACIGKIKQSKVDVENKDIVIASLQSLAMRDYNIDIFKEFGFVIIDEVHHMGAEVFSRAFQKMNAPVILGLSATLNRKDGMRRVFENFIGKSVYKLQKNEKITVNVQIHKYFDTDISYSAKRVLWNGKPNVAAMINNICSFENRTLFIIDLIKDVLKNEKDRKFLILSERRNHLTKIETELQNKDISQDIGYYVGGMTQDKLDISSNKQIILATYQMAAEGMNIPSLNTVIFASPISDIQQSIGRILREKPNERKYIPLCIDIWDEFSVFKNKGFTRIKYYEKNGYDVKYYLDNEEIKVHYDKKDEKVQFIDDE
jgi:superfamily II DNA or RNA helicase